MIDTQHTPTDSEMLDFMIKNGASMYLEKDEGWCQFVKGYYWSEIYPTPRAAISAEMMKEKEL